MKLNFNSIPKFCINLKRSTDRKLLAIEEFKKVGIDVSFFEAVDKNDLTVPELSTKLITEPHGHLTGILACMTSHVALLKKAQELNLPAICIFEDDIIFCEDFNERIKYIESLEDFDFDFLSLGGHFPTKVIEHEDASETMNPYIYKTHHHGGTYAYIITKKVYDFVIRNITYNYGMDQFYSDFVYSRFNCYAFVPFLCACSYVTSEITDVLWKYENVDWHYRHEKIEGLINNKK